ncbi:MAG: apolipoprotein N-acyltransferase [Desulfovibrio sp.]|nr:apolipoprotein N-acyltransferase [Desulfovibrio sp.]
MPLHSLFFVLLGACGLVIGFPNNILNLPVLIFLWPLSHFFLATKAHSAAQAFGHGYCLSFLGMTATLYWICLPIQIVGGLPLPAAISCLLAITSILSLGYGFFTQVLWLARALPPLYLALFASCAWVCVELVEAILSKFPWLNFAAALTPWPILVQSAAYVGCYGISLIYSFILFCLLVAHQRKNWCTFAFGAIALGTLLTANYTLLATQEKDGRSVSVLFVEGNINQNQKWDAKFQQATFNHYAKLTQEGLAQHPETELIIWSETAMPFFYEISPLAAQIQKLVQHLHRPLLFGAPGTLVSSSTRTPPVYNRATLLNSMGQTIGQYEKEQLVPFGEYTPSWLHFDFLDPLLQGIGTYTPGQHTAPLLYKDLSFGMLICYEGIFPWLAQRRVTEGANLLIDISNDTWFAQTSALRQHLYLTALRAVEQQRWILRATNSGISAVIDSHGRIVCQGPIAKAGSLIAHANTQTKYSFFHEHWLAELIIFGLLFLSLLGYLLKQYHNMKTKKDQT